MALRSPGKGASNLLPAPLRIPQRKNHGKGGGDIESVPLLSSSTGEGTTQHVEKLSDEIEDCEEHGEREGHPSTLPSGKTSHHYTLPSMEKQKPHQTNLALLSSSEEGSTTAIMDFTAKDNSEPSAQKTRIPFSRSSSRRTTNSKLDALVSRFESLDSVNNADSGDVPHHHHHTVYSSHAPSKLPRKSVPRSSQSSCYTNHTKNPDMMGDTANQQAIQPQAMAITDATCETRAVPLSLPKKIEVRGTTATEERKPRMKESASPSKQLRPLSGQRSSVSDLRKSFEQISHQNEDRKAALEPSKSPEKQHASTGSLVKSNTYEDCRYGGDLGQGTVASKDKTVSFTQQLQDTSHADKLCPTAQGKGHESYHSPTSRTIKAVVARSSEKTGSRYQDQPQYLSGLPPGFLEKDAMTTRLSVPSSFTEKLHHSASAATITTRTGRSETDLTIQSKDRMSILRKSLPPHHRHPSRSLVDISSTILRDHPTTAQTSTTARALSPAERTLKETEDFLSVPKSTFDGCSKSHIPTSSIHDPQDPTTPSREEAKSRLAKNKVADLRIFFDRPSAALRASSPTFNPFTALIKAKQRRSVPDVRVTAAVDGTFMTEPEIEGMGETSQANPTRHEPLPELPLVDIGLNDFACDFGVRRNSDLDKKPPHIQRISKEVSYSSLPNSNLTPKPHQPSSPAKASLKSLHDSPLKAKINRYERLSKESICSPTRPITDVPASPIPTAANHPRKPHIRTVWRRISNSLTWTVARPSKNRRETSSSTPSPASTTTSPAQSSGISSSSRAAGPAFSTPFKHLFARPPPPLSLSLASSPTAFAGGGCCDSSSVDIDASLHAELDVSPPFLRYVRTPSASRVREGERENKTGVSGGDNLNPNRNRNSVQGQKRKLSFLGLSRFGAGSLWVDGAAESKEEGGTCGVVGDGSRGRNTTRGMDGTESTNDHTSERRQQRREVRERRRAARIESLKNRAGGKAKEKREGHTAAVEATSSSSMEQLAGEVEDAHSQPHPETSSVYPSARRWPMLHRDHNKQSQNESRTKPKAKPRIPSNLFHHHSSTTPTPSPSTSTTNPEKKRQRHKWQRKDRERSWGKKTASGFVVHQSAIKPEGIVQPRPCRPGQVRNILAIYKDKSASLLGVGQGRRGEGSAGSGGGGSGGMGGMRMEKAGTAED